MDLLLLALVTIAPKQTPAHAPDLELPAIFGDHMVLQCDSRVPIWGHASPGQTIRVRVGDVGTSTSAGSDGNWIAWFDCLPAGGPHRLEVTGEEQLVFEDVWIGEVWLGSGQSNMAMSVDMCRDFTEEAARAELPRLRMFREESGPSERAEWRGAGRWQVCTPETVSKFSATLFFFGRELHAALDAPVGLLDSSMGGTPIQSWIGAEAQYACPELRDFLERFERKHDSFDPERAVARWEKEVEAWKKEVERARAEGTEPPYEPIHPVEAYRRKGDLGGLFNAKIAPLVPFGIRGVVWYQGEQNAGHHNSPYYSRQLSLLVEDWRVRWNRPKLPFVWVQLPNYSSPNSFWPTIREAMRRTLVIDGTGMVVTIDIGESDRIHPRNKQDVGKRLAAWALGTVYGRDVITSGPLFATHEILGNEVIVRFLHTDGGLTTPDGEPRGFELADERGRWHPATARIEETHIVVRSAGVEHPTAVRYAWADEPDCNLYNGAGLPASPFTSVDD